MDPEREHFMKSTYKRDYQGLPVEERYLLMFYTFLLNIVISILCDE